MPSLTASGYLVSLKWSIAWLLPPEPRSDYSNQCARDDEKTHEDRVRKRLDSMKMRADTLQSQMSVEEMMRHRAVTKKLGGQCDGSNGEAKLCRVMSEE